MTRRNLRARGFQNGPPLGPNNGPIDRNRQAVPPPGGAPALGEPDPGPTPPFRHIDSLCFQRLGASALALSITRVGSARSVSATVSRQCLLELSCASVASVRPNQHTAALPLVEPRPSRSVIAVRSSASRVAVALEHRRLAQTGEQSEHGLPVPAHAFKRAPSTTRPSLRL